MRSLLVVLASLATSSVAVAAPAGPVSAAGSGSGSGLAARVPAPRPAGEHEVELPDLGLTLRLPELEGLRERGEPAGQLRGSWSGRLGGSEVAIELVVLPAEGFGLVEPDHVVDVVVDHERGRGRDVVVLETFHHEGAVGHAPYLAAARLASGPEGTEETLLAAGLLPEHGYALRFAMRPPTDEARAAARALVEEGVAYQGPVRDPEWTDEEALARWRRDAPERLHDDFARALERPRTRRDAVIRTDHYLVMTNASGGKTFAKAMEENYERIAEVFPFDEVEGRRLMPVFLFRTAEEYYDFYAKVAGVDREVAAASKGHAWKDYYATWYESPVDPVHVHEQTHQVFANRLGLQGGGSWFQEGVAEYVETTENDRNVVASLVEDGRHTPLRDLVQLESLLYSSTGESARGGDSAADHYKLAALLIEFLRESRFGRKRFAEFLTVMGEVPRGDAEAIDAAFRRVYGVGIEGVEEAWREYCGRR